MGGDRDGDENLGGGQGSVDGGEDGGVGDDRDRNNVTVALEEAGGSGAGILPVRVDDGGGQWAGGGTDAQGDR